MQSISIIIPTLNEEEHIEKLLRYLCTFEESLELIVVDGGSSDATRSIAGKFATVLEAPRGRAVQMNFGAEYAAAEILWFLHADVLPHPESAAAILTALKNPSVVGGAFEYRLTGERKFYRVVEFFSNRKNRLFKLLYGDMGIFVRKSVFNKVGGYPPLPLMEDMELVKRLREEGELTILPLPIMTSARRWEKEGIFKNMVRNWLLQIAWKAGVKPEVLATYYRFE